MPNHRIANCRAFTLIELLIVIAIIALLAAILFPVFSRARDNARRAACLSNMKQLGTAVMMYTQDYDEMMPGNDSLDEGAGLTNGFMDSSAVRNWAKSIDPYLKNLQVFRCPSALPYTATGSSGSAYAEVSGSNGGNTSYAGNYIVADRKLAAIPTPASTVFLHEFNIYQRAAQMRPYPSGNNFTQFHNTKMENLHFDGGNRLFCDGHAKWSKKSNMTFAEYGAADNGGQLASTAFNDSNINWVFPAAF